MSVCRVEGIRLYYEMSGEGFPLLLINGLSADIRQWELLLVPPSNARWLHERLRGSRLTVLPGVGHMVPIEAPRELAAVIREEG